MSVDSIRSVTDDASFIRGRGYLSEGRVYDALAVDGTVRGMCVGSMDFDYEMEIRLGKDGIESAVCTCPRGGFCKHLVALALLFVERPDDVVQFDAEALTQDLRRRPVEELAALLVDHARGDFAFARRLLRLDDSGQSTTADAPPTVPFVTLVEQYRERAERCCPADYHNPYRGALECASELKSLLMREERMAQGDPVRLLAFYIGVYQSIEERLGELDDSEGALGGVAWECARGMRDVVARDDCDSAARREWLRIVIPLCLENDYGIGDGLHDAIREVSDAEEVGLAEGLIRGYLDQAGVRSEQSGSDDDGYQASAWHRQHRLTVACELLAGFYRASGREAEIDALYLETGLHHHYVMHRLAMGDAVTAVTHACDHLRGGYDLQRFGQALTDTGNLAAAREFLDHVVPLLERNTPYRDDILALHASLAERLGDPQRALELRFQAFRERPAVNTFRAALTTARALGLEEDYDRKMVEACATESRQSERLVEIHIFRRDIDAALEAFARTPPYRSEELELRLAAAAAETHPEASRELIIGVVERNIGRKNRSHYARAASVAGRLRGVMDEAEFAHYVADLRERYRRLPALQDELNKMDGIHPQGQ